MKAFTDPRLILGLALAGFGSGAAHAKDLTIWVAPVLYGYSESKCVPHNADSPRAATQIDSRLCAALNPDANPAFVAHFKREMLAAFPDRITEKPGHNLPDSVPLDQRLNSTLSASLHISRANIWTVSQNNGANTVYLPVSITLNLTNINTGEVMFTQRLSLIKPLTAEDRNVERFAREQLPDHLREAISQLVRQSAALFSPNPVSATVRGAHDKSYVIDRGRSAGILTGESLRDDVKVLFADADYAIVKPTIPDEKLENGLVLSKPNFKPAEYLAKHSVMVVNGTTPEGMSPSYLKRIFEDRLGTTATFNISYVNPAIENIRRLAVGAALSNANNNMRPAPDYFIYFESYALAPTRLPTNIPGRFINTYEAYTIAYITDSSGRIVYSQIATDRLTDEVGSIGFSTEQRQETAVSNSIVKVVDLIATEFKPSSLRIPISVSHGEVTVVDPNGMLSDDAVGMVLRKAGRVGGIRDVWTRVNTSRISFDDDKVVLKQEDETEPKTISGDVFAIESGGAMAAGSRQAFGACPAQENLPRGDLSADPMLRSIALSRFYQAKRVPLYLEGLPELVRPPLKHFETGGSRLGILEGRPTDICIKTIVRITHEGPVKSPKNQRSDGYNLVFGYNLISKNNERLAGYGTSINFTTSPISQDTPEIEFDRSLSREVARIFSANIKSAAVGTNISEGE